MVKRFELFTSAISGIYRDIQKIGRDEMERYGLKGAYAQYLLAIDRYPEGITAAQLCDICDKNKAAVSRIAAEMESKGLITRKGVNNQYKAPLLLTEEGSKAVRYVKERAGLAAEIAGRGLTDEARKNLYISLRMIANHLQKFCENGLPLEKEPNQ